MTQSIEQLLRDRIEAAFQLGYKHFDESGIEITDPEEVLDRLMAFEPVKSVPPEPKREHLDPKYKLTSCDKNDFAVPLDSIRLNSDGKFIIPKQFQIQ